MHIQELKLNHYRGAYNLSIPLREHLNVFVGMNGAGKSTLLDATATLLSWLVNRIKSSGSSGQPITEKEIMNGWPSANLSLTLNIDDDLYRWGIAKTRKNIAAKEFTSDLSAVSSLAKKIQSELLTQEAQAKLPLFVYYPVNRSVLDIPLRIREKHRFDLLSCYDHALGGGANFRTFFEWFREREDLENEAYRDLNSFFPEHARTAYPDPQLTAVREALEQLMPSFKNLTVRRSPLRMEVEKNGQLLTVNQLSDGEKCLMAMIGDMARRMAIANPKLEKPLTGEGIFLIDEIDLHLHPTWQQMIIPRLTNVFPNCQFLISTHSPQVITHVQAENLFLLKMYDGRLDWQAAGESYGKTAERVLEDLMGLETTRPKEIDQKIKEVFAQISDGELDKARNLIQKLQARIGTDPELIKANVLIRRKELIDK